MRTIAAVMALSLALTSIASAQTPPGASAPPVSPTPSASALTPSPAPMSSTLNPLVAQALTSQAQAVASPSTATAVPGVVGATITTTDGTAVPVFGANLFAGPMSGSRPGDLPDYKVQPGDQVSITIYGALTAAGVQSVDAAGNVFIPSVGPVHVAGTTSGQLQATLEAKVHSFYNASVGVYATLVQAGTIGVFVSGNVPHPGRFLGSTHDSVLFFLAQAGGVNPSQGSFRNIAVQRGGATIATYDLYDFLVAGRTRPLTFQDGDSVVVAPRGSMVGVSGGARNANAFEARPGTPMTGAQLVDLAKPEANVTDVALTGFRNGQPQSAYFSLQDFARVVLGDGDHVTFASDAFQEHVTVKISGEVIGPSVYVLPRGATLGQLLGKIPLAGTDIEPKFVHIQRVDVATEQKRALNDSLWNLQKEVLTAAPISPEQAQLATAQAALVTQFVQQAQAVQPDGNIAVYTNGSFHDIMLRDQDTVVLPNRSDVVIVTGEILNPGALAWRQGTTIDEYVSRAGGFSPNANKGKIVIRHRDGSAEVANKGAKPGLGDEVVVVPKIGSPWLVIATDLTQILFQIAVTAGTVINVAGK